MGGVPSHLKLCALTPEYIPVFFEILADVPDYLNYSEWYFYGTAMLEIAKVMPDDYDPRYKERFNDCPSAKQWYAWWEGREKIPEKFAADYKQWKSDRKADGGVLSTSKEVLDPKLGEVVKVVEATAFAKTTQKIRNYGLDAIPLIIEQFEAKNYDLMFVFEQITGRKEINLEGNSSTPEERCLLHVKWWRDPSETAPAMKFQMPPLDAHKKLKAKN